MTPLSQRPVPEGFTLEWDKSAWNVGFVFMWSEVYQCYMKKGMLTVKPEQTLAEAYEVWADEPMFSENEIFFSDSL